MNKVAVVTDSNSGITQQQAKDLGIHVIPMPFTINGKDYFEDIDLTQQEFYEKLNDDADIGTSQPAAGTVLDLWEELLKDYDEIVHIPMSSGLSGSCETALALAADYDGKVQVLLPLSEAGKGRPAGHGRDNRKHRNTKTGYK